MKTVRRATSIRFPPGSTIRASGPSTVIGRRRPVSRYTLPRTEALAAFGTLGPPRGHFAGARKFACRGQGDRTGQARTPQDVIVVCLSGRGDKDAAEIARLTGPISPANESAPTRHIMSKIDKLFEPSRPAQIGPDAVYYGRRSRPAVHRGRAPEFVARGASLSNWAFPTATRSPTAR